MKPVIIIPAKDEQATILNVIRDIRQSCDFPILVVDDASDDKTGVLASSEGCMVLRLTLNLGAWKATQAGIRFAIKKGFNTAITMDADGQHKPSEIDKLIECKKKGFDVVIGSCISRADMGRNFAWKTFGKISGLKVSDLTSGFRLYGKSAMIALSGKRATMLDYQDLGVLLIIKQFGLRASEVEVSMDKRKEGRSRIFGSWLSILNYMIYTLILTASKTFSFSSRRYRKEMLKEGRLD